MFGHIKLQHQEAEDLTGFAYIGKEQFLVAGLALVWSAVDNDFVGLSGSTTSNATWLQPR